ncbi:hypothetical protein CHS0354_001006 [Potamilus streckersoni]|uniref:Uncharacterized protein n=1 Tax=Potamilus streckersoni TaxID=2493646 RepID=A0AAE0SU25_9BIVA|nr:hypothetical protein CHS0354_001006 [Potamilus streckersoni]
MRTIPKSEEGSKTFETNIQSLNVENKVCPIRDRNYEISSPNPSLQDVKAVSLSDYYIAFKIGDIYDTPRCKDQQYTVVLQGNNEQLLNRTDTRSKQKSATEENNCGTEDSAIRLDYELAKQIDF